MTDYAISDKDGRTMLITDNERGNAADDQKARVSKYAALMNEKGRKEAEEHDQ